MAGRRVPASIRPRIVPSGAASPWAMTTAIAPFSAWAWTPPAASALPPAVVEEAFIEANPDLAPDGITVTCDSGRLDEVRICLTRDLQPRACAPDSRRDCRAPMLMEAPG